MTVAAFGFLILQTTIAYLICFVIEGMSPASESNTPKNLSINCFLTVLYFALRITLGSAITAGMSRLSNNFHLFDLSAISDHGQWLAGLGVAAIFLVLHDFVFYWVHRAQHAWPWLWAEHAVHHSDEHMGVTTSFRHHWLEAFIDAAFVAGPLILLLKPPTMTALSAYLLTQFYGDMIHLNSTMSLGPLNRFITNPSVHRIHHSKLPEHLDKNFAAFFPMWDVLFGTYHAPDRSAKLIPTGLADGSDKIDSAAKAFFYPFQRWAIMMLTHLTP